MPFLQELLLTLIKLVLLLCYVETLDPFECLLNEDRERVAESRPRNVVVIVREGHGSIK